MPKTGTTKVTIEAFASRTMPAKNTNAGPSAPSPAKTTASSSTPSATAPTPSPRPNTAAGEPTAQRLTARAPHTPAQHSSRGPKTEVNTGNTSVAASKPRNAGPVRLGPGELRRLVLEHLLAHPDQELTPAQLSNLLHRSAGAIFNALETLRSQDTITRTKDRPRTYQITRTHPSRQASAATD